MLPRLWFAIAVALLLQTSACAQSKHSEWVEDDDVPAPHNPPAYADPNASTAQPQQPQTGTPTLTPGAGGQPLPRMNGGYQPSSTYQRMYKQFFEDDDVEDESGTKRGGKKKQQGFMPLNQFPGSQVGQYNSYGNGSYATPYSSGSSAGIQQGFGAPMYVGPEVPYPTYPGGGIQYGPPGVLNTMPYSPYGNLNPYGNFGYGRGLGGGYVNGQFFNNNMYNNGFRAGGGGGMISPQPITPGKMQF
jgi:hypothetical protein